MLGSDGLVELQFLDRTAGEVDSEIESFEDEADEPWQDDQNREEVPPLAVGREMFDHDVCSSVLSLIHILR